MQIGLARAFVDEHRDQSVDDGLFLEDMDLYKPSPEANAPPTQTTVIPQTLSISNDTNASPVPIARAGPDDRFVRQGYNVPSDAEVIYTDGACPSNGTVAGRAGIGVFFGINDKRNISARLPGLHQTNQRAELFAVLKALEAIYTTHLPGSKRNIYILTDSKYVVRALTEWAVRWEREGWKSTGNKEVISKDLFKRARDLMRALADVNVMISFRHIPGHSGIWGNEQADKLAVMGAHMDKVVFNDWDEEFDDEELEQELMELQYQLEEEIMEMQHE
jgi:ribonuclease HI